MRPGFFVNLDMAATKQKKGGLAFPASEPLTNKEIAALVKEAEKGPFYTSQQVKQAVKTWSKKYSK